MIVEPVYFTAPNGVVYRVYDAIMRAGVLVIANPPATGATSRVFRPKEGYRRLYQFANDETRVPTPEQLERQLQRAEYLPSSPPHDPPGDPR